MADVEQRKNTNKKILKWFGIAFGVLIVFFVVIGIIMKPSAESIAKAEAEAKAHQDSISASLQAATALHDSLMANSKPYRDSVKQAEAELARRIEEEDKVANPEKYVEVDLDWKVSGFGAVAIGDFTITNNSLTDMKDPVVEVTFYGESGTELGSAVETLTIVCKAGRKARVNDVNLGFIKSQTSKAGAKLVSATWGGE